MGSLCRIARKYRRYEVAPWKMFLHAFTLFFPFLAFDPEALALYL